MKWWEEKGIAVQVCQGIERFVDADVLVSHVNLTTVPREYVDFMARYPLVVNRQLLDISKSRISANIVRPGDDYDGPVIVKTDRNFGGKPEKWFSVQKDAPKGEICRMLRKFRQAVRGTSAGGIDWRNVKHLDPSTYPVYPSLDDVPKGVFRNRHLVVEKFLPEMDGDRYCLRNWLFLGDQGVNTISMSPAKVVKSTNTVDRREVPVPDELRVIRQRLHVDYGKLDYVMKDGRPILFDINRTPSYRGPQPSETALKAAKLMAQGIESFWARGPEPSVAAA